MPPSKIPKHVALIPWHRRPQIHVPDATGSTLVASSTPPRSFPVPTPHRRRDHLLIDPRNTLRSHGRLRRARAGWDGEWQPPASGSFTRWRAAATPHPTIRGADAELV